jgi:hypothetical protein
MPLPSRFWQDLPWPEFRSLPANTVAVLPVGAIEQHGPHLPVAVDTAINQGIVARTLMVIPDDLPVLVLPTQAVALSVEHLRYPGTITTSAETLIALICDIGASVARAGVKRMVFLNSHGGNVSALDIALAEELGYRIKLLGIARREDGGISTRVHPCMVPISAPIARVDGVFNAVVAEGDFVGRVMMEGRGAGEGPTASAVVADVIDIARGRFTPVWGAEAAALKPEMRQRGGGGDRGSAAL